ncbi:hypothetical protein TrLO_g14142 [Triparma laevis f. longispina]|uniref:Uncharacterized protein n=1 Tax=Triparma laevis f. longispina TaxID=1714387 RepID=A0A9W7CAY3_9STRA|nr:hypothetical protein TrLO_g14142 [Triparma laevis f. longispina]
MRFITIFAFFLLTRTTESFSFTPPPSRFCVSSPSQTTAFRNVHGFTTLHETNQQQKAGGRATLPLPPDKPLLSFSLSFFTSLLTVPILTTLLPITHTAHIFLALLLLALSLPLALIFAPLAALLSTTINSPTFSNRLLNLYNKTVPPSVDTSAKESFNALLDKIEQSGLSVLLSDRSGDVVEFATWIFSPFLGSFLNTVRRFASNIQDNGESSAEGLGTAVVDTILDASSTTLTDFTTLVSSVYATITTILFLVFFAFTHSS